MSTRPAPEATVRRALWLGGLLIVLGGLLGMHGLDAHGVESAGPASMAGMAATDAGHRLTSSAADLAELSLSAATDASHSGMDVGAAMCLAVLGLGLLALVLRLSTRQGHRPFGLVERPVRVTAGHGREPDPPSLIRLSIRRC